MELIKGGLMEKYNFKIPFNKPFIVGKELYYIAKAVMDLHLSGDGTYTKLCHKWFEENFHCAKALLTHSCTGALEMSAILTEVKPGDEVIMPSFTFVSTANAFVLRGATPVFIDINTETLNMNENLIESAISSKTKVIVPVHYAGAPCEMDKIMNIAKKHALIVVEDAAQGIFSTYHGRYLGTIGHLGCLSFHETKNVISGEGGILLINDPIFIERAEIIREKGTNRSKFFRGEVDKYTWIDIGSSYLPTELVGAFLYAQLEEAEKINNARRRIFKLYYDLLRPLEEEELITLPSQKVCSACNGHIFYILTKDLNERERLTQYLKNKGILVVFHYVPLHSSLAGQKYGQVCGAMNITDNISERLLRLPLFYGMLDEDIIKVVQAMNSFYLNN
jgi:dTDP-4-amino-4,6-dideoxygalactose transaminase